jgi:hypothetical protein
VNLLIAGSRHLCPSVEQIDSALQRWEKICNDAGIFWWTPITHVISGTARGVDAHGEQWARARGLPVIRMPANWDRYGKAAGMVRNREMARIAALGLIFWDNQSAGTRNMIDLLHEYKRNCHIVFDQPVQAGPPLPMRGL